VEIGVRVKVVRNEPEAEAVCAMLRAHGISCSYRETDIAAMAFGGWQEILVGRADADAASELVAQTSE
jgi:hypothetical protein